MSDTADLTVTDAGALTRQLHDLVTLAMGAVDAPVTRANYTRALRRYVTWLGATGGTITAESLRAYLVDARITPSMQPLTIAAVRRLVREAAGMGVGIDRETVEAISRVTPPNPPPKGARTGNWLTQKQLTGWLNAIDERRVTSPRWLRDAAAVALMAGCGMRREEATGLRECDLRRVEGRWVAEIQHGKGNKRRGVAVPDWAWAWIGDWLKILPGTRAQRVAAGLPVLRAVYGEGWAKRGSDGASVGVSVEPLSGESLRGILKRLMREIPVRDENGRDTVHLKPHDLRRTWAVLGLRNGASIDLIQRAMGHGDIKTTQVYLRAAEELRPGKGAGDYVMKGVVMRPEFWDKIENRLGSVGELEREKWRVILERVKREDEVRSDE